MEVNIHVVLSCESSTHACMSNKYKYICYVSTIMRNISVATHVLMTNKSFKDVNNHNI